MVSPILKSPFNYIYINETFIEISKINQAFLSLPFINQFLFSDGNTNQNYIKVSKELYSTLLSAGVSINDFIINGKGLNPLLQNFWMQIHPPVLFLGFALGSVPFVFAISALIKNNYENWIKYSFPWILAAGGVLGLGIMLGGYWAYGVLGWGGYWAWDPVENSSLVPWIIMVAVIHTMIVQKKSQEQGEKIGRFAKTNLILAILTFVSIVYSTFLTRSGILGDSSVHSFVDPGSLVYLFLLIFVFTFLGIGLGLVFYRWKSLSLAVKSEESFYSRELSLFSATIILGASSLIVFVGTSAPIFGISVDISFYDKMHIPLAIVMGIINGISVYLRWKDTKSKEVLSQITVPAILTLVITIGIVFLGEVYKPMMILLAASSVFPLIINLQMIVKFIPTNFHFAGGYFSHFGISLFILGVIGSGAYSSEQEIDLPKGKQLNLFGFNLEFKGYEPIENNTKYAFNIEISENGNKKIVSPIMYISSFNQSLMREPFIMEGFLKDIYISPISFDEGNDNNSRTENAFSLVPGQEYQFDSIRIKYLEFISPDMSLMSAGSNFEMGAKLYLSYKDKTETINLLMKKEGNSIVNIPVTLKDANSVIVLNQIDPMSKKADIGISKISATTGISKPEEVLTVSISKKPFVSLVWFGVFFTTIGFFFSMIRRIKMD